MKIGSNDRMNTEDEIKYIVKTMYYCLKHYDIICPKFQVLKKEYYDKNNPKEITKINYMLGIFSEPYCDYETIKKYISTCPKHIKNNFRNHIPFIFMYGKYYYYYNGKTFLMYEELFPLDYVKEVAENSSSRGQAYNDSILVLEEFDDSGDNNDSYYICKQMIETEWYISSFEKYSRYFGCHEYIDDLFYDMDSFEDSIYQNKDTVLFTYNPSELEELLNFEVIQIYE